MNKTLKSLGLAILLLVVAVGVYFAFFSPSPGNTAGKISVPAKQGQPIVVNDFTKNPVQTVPSTTVIARSSNYEIAYFTQDKSFSISLRSTPLKDARIAAEQALLSTLNITQDQACQLNISVSTTYDVDPDNAGRELGLSFCPGSVQF